MVVSGVQRGDASLQREGRQTEPPGPRSSSSEPPRPDGAPIYVITGNLSAQKGARILQWAGNNKVELCFAPANVSWANPIEAHFGPPAGVGLGSL